MLAMTLYPEVQLEIPPATWNVKLNCDLSLLYYISAAGSTLNNLCVRLHST